MNRIYHTWDKWECYPAGFYEAKHKTLTKEECEQRYKDLLTDLPLFENTLFRVVTEWVNSCEHYLSNDSMNRVAWLGQASLTYIFQIPACYRGGYNRLTDKEKGEADLMALKYLNMWLNANGRKELDWEAAQSKTVANLY